MQETGYLFRTDFTVRDYECDIQGVVNNANYQHYLEHARHQFLVSKGISFYDLHEEGLDLIVTKVEIEYKYPLRSCDRFFVTINMAREGNVRIVFTQDIFRIPDNKLIVKARITIAAIKSGRPVAPPVDLIKQLGLE
ncbi:MAG: thioesterase family protein [Bacteroidota bacterium]|nr:thioesterase family protein [Bacteroidota bacterium]